MIAVVAVVASAAVLVVTRSSKTNPHEILGLDRGPVPKRMERPIMEQDIASDGDAEGSSAILPNASP